MIVKTFLFVNNFLQDIIIIPSFLIKNTIGVKMSVIYPEIIKETEYHEKISYINHVLEENVITI